MIGKKRKKSKKAPSANLQKYANCGGQNALPDEVREKFLEAYEKTCGNISASCEYAGMHRTTFYLWMEVDSPANLEFREKLAAWYEWANCEELSR